MLYKVVKHIRQRTFMSTLHNKIKNAVLRNHNYGIAWQLKRDNNAKYNLVKPILEELSVENILDVGCNAGMITRQFGNDGFFSVGIDRRVDFRGIESPLKNACIGNYVLDKTNIEKLPIFDAILLLSVHHQLIFNYGNDYTQDYVLRLASKSKIIFVIEFAALNRKYTNNIENVLFIDNDEESIITYAYTWLEQTLPSWNLMYIGKAPESLIEPFRFLFACRKD